MRYVISPACSGLTPGVSQQLDVPRKASNKRILLSAQRSSGCILSSSGCLNSCSSITTKDLQALSQRDGGAIQLFSMVVITHAGQKLLSNTCNVTGGYMGGRGRKDEEEEIQSEPKTQNEEEGGEESGNKGWGRCGGGISGTSNVGRERKGERKTSRDERGEETQL